MDIFAYADQVQRGFELKSCGSVQYFIVPSIEQLGYVKHCFTSRLGGVSQGSFASLNFSFKREPEKSHIYENFRIIASALEVEYESIVIANYCHGDGVEIVGKEQCGFGLTRPNALPPCDSLIVNEPGVTAITMHADCVPVFFADVKKRFGAVCHAGWKGVYSRIAQKTAHKLIHQLGMRPEELVIGIGPHIRSCCFEVQEDVLNLFREEFGSFCLVEREQKHYVDLSLALLSQLREEGVLAPHITVANECTKCREDLLYSHRRDGKKAGAMASLMQII